MNDPQSIIDLEAATADQARDGQRTDLPLISSEPLVTPPSFAEVPMALVKQRGVLVGIVVAALVGVLLVWRNNRDA